MRELLRDDCAISEQAPEPALFGRVEGGNFGTMVLGV